MYELMLVSKLGAGDELLSLVEKNLKGASAFDLTVDKLGKKPLAYAIKKQVEAEFIVLNFNVEAAAISDLTDALRLEQENLLRYLLTTQKRKKAKQKKFVGKKDEVIPKDEKTKAKVTVVTTKVTKPSSSKVIEGEKVDVKERLKTEKRETKRAVTPIKSESKSKKK